MLFGKSPEKMTNEEKCAQIDAMYQGAKAKAFPDVPEISAAEVKQRLEAGEDLLLLDVRTPEERAVSVIPGSVPLDSLAEALDQHTDATVVCYCTIGGRSGQCTAELRSHGINAHNMPGAVLAWSHAGGTFVDDTGETKRIHVHGPKFNLVADGYEGVW